MQSLTKINFEWDVCIKVHATIPWTRTCVKFPAVFRARAEDAYRMRRENGPLAIWLSCDVLQKTDFFPKIIINSYRPWFRCALTSLIFDWIRIVYVDIRVCPAVWCLVIFHAIQFFRPSKSVIFCKIKDEKWVLGHVPLCMRQSIDRFIYRYVDCILNIDHSRRSRVLRLFFSHIHNILRVQNRLVFQTK